MRWGDTAGTSKEKSQLGTFGVYEKIILKLILLQSCQLHWADSRYNRMVITVIQFHWESSNGHNKYLLLKQGPLTKQGIGIAPT
jgi:hypothetical protein